MDVTQLDKNKAQTNVVLSLHMEPENGADVRVSEAIQTDVGVEEVKIEACVQANDYEIERATGTLPARKRFIPVKFRDFHTMAGLDEEKHDDDSDYEPEVSFPPPKKARAERRGRPRKHKVEGEETGGEEATKKPPMVRVANGYKCTACNKVFSQKGNLKVHLITHTDERPFRCDVEDCKKSFRTKESLRRHKLSHFGIKPFECEECKKKFCSALSLQEHMSRHTNSKPYVCDTCARAFRQVSCLRRHILTHTQEQPYACTVCSRCFSQAVYLRSHMKVHTGERPFPCDQCNKAFAHASDLSRHKVIHTGQKPYACSTCQMCFSDPSSRRRHEREHLGCKPYSCHLCNEGFKRAGQLRAHLFRRHGGLKEGVEFHIQEGPEPVCYRIELHDAEGNGDGKDYQDRSSAGGALVTKMIDLSSMDENKIVTFIRTLDPNIVVQVADSEGETTEAAANMVSESKGNVGVADMEQMVVPAEVAAIMEAGDGSGAGNVITIAEVGEDTDGGEVKTTYQILQELPGEGDLSDQQIYEVHYQSIPETKQSSDVTVDQSSTTLVSSASVTPTSSTSTASSSSSKTISGVSTTTSYQDTTAFLTAKSSGCTPASAATANAMQPTPDYINKPDFGCQEYFNWLSDFTESCKLVPIPLEVALFQKISHVHKTLSDFMASPSGVITDKENFRILMSISKDLNYILNEHLTYMLLNLSDGDNAQNQS